MKDPSSGRRRIKKCVRTADLNRARVASNKKRPKSLRQSSKGPREGQRDIGEMCWIPGGIKIQNIELRARWREKLKSERSIGGGADWGRYLGKGKEDLANCPSLGGREKLASA